MRLHLYRAPVVTAVLLLSINAVAQTSATKGEATCEARREAIEHDMDVARSKGQLLRRRELGKTLVVLQRECGTGGDAQSELRVRIRQQEETVEGLRRELRDAEEELRRLRTAVKP